MYFLVSLGTSEDEASSIALWVKVIHASSRRKWVFFLFQYFFFSFFPPHILYCCLFTWFWLLKNEDNFCLLFCIDLFPYTYSWHPPSQMVWSWGWIQCYGYWPSWSKPRRPFQLLQSEVLFEDSVNACWSVSKLAIACRNGFYVIKMVAILNFFFFTSTGLHR